MQKTTRRRFILAGLTAAIAVPGACAIDGFCIEPRWLKIKRLSLAKGKPSLCVVHFSDLHYKGDRAYLKKAVRMINNIAADLVCFTGDIVEEDKWLDEALEILAGIKKPLFGVPGNHDYWAKTNQAKIDSCFQSGGGAWLRNSTHEFGSDIVLYGSDSGDVDFVSETGEKKRILLSHYPASADLSVSQPFDLILAGHTHGGQIALPVYGALVTPYSSADYEYGLYQTASGPLYVNPGIGTFAIPARFYCRPELTVITI